MMLYLRQPTGLICILGNKRMNDKKRNIRKNGSMHAYLFLLPSLTGVLVLAQAAGLEKEISIF